MKQGELCKAVVPVSFCMFEVDDNVRSGGMLATPLIL